jgi:hypothetical protein
MDNVISQFISQINNEFHKIFTPESGTSASEGTNRQAASPPKRAYTIAHLLPGRVRLHVPSIFHNPSYVERLKALLEAEQWVTSERINPKAASIIITYKHKMISNSEMRSRLANLIESAAAATNSLVESTQSAFRVSENVQQAKPTVQVTEETPKVKAPPKTSTQPVAKRFVNPFFRTQSPPQQTIVTEESPVQQDVIPSKSEQRIVVEPSLEVTNRVFLIEVVGLHQGEETDENNWSIRHSGSVIIRVPYNRMNQKIQSINRLGGKIVSIRPA